MTFKTAVWVDPETESYCARIFPEAEGINLAAWGLTADALSPIDLTNASLTGPRGLGQMIEEELHKIAPGFDSKQHFEPIFLGYQQRGADVRAALTEKLAAVAA